MSSSEPYYSFTGIKRERYISLIYKKQTHTDNVAQHALMWPSASNAMLIHTGQ